MFEVETFYFFAGTLTLSALVIFYLREAYLSVFFAAVSFFADFFFLPWFETILKTSFFLSIDSYKIKQNATLFYKSVWRLLFE
jgi:hypothetical protein